MDVLFDQDASVAPSGWSGHDRRKRVPEDESLIFVTKKLPRTQGRQRYARNLHSKSSLGQKTIPVLVLL